MFCSMVRIADFLRAIDALGLSLKNVLIWLKSNMVLTFGEFCPQYEPIIYAGKTDTIRRNPNKGMSNVLFCHNRKMRTEFNIPWYHPTSKPIKLLRDLLDATTIVGDLICDAFAGTGSTLIACHRTGRRFAGVELSERYCIAACMRYRYETAKQIPVYELIGDRQIELSDAYLKAEFEHITGAPEGEPQNNNAESNTTLGVGEAISSLNSASRRPCQLTLC